MEKLKRFSMAAMVVVVRVSLFKFNMATSIAFFGIVSATKNYVNHMEIDFKPNIRRVKWFTVYTVFRNSKNGREKAVNIHKYSGKTRLRNCKASAFSGMWKKDTENAIYSVYLCGFFSHENTI